MKIVFLCGSLEPGRDGVGDYTRRLAGEMIRQGNQAAAVALKDPHLEELFIGRQDSEGVDLPVLRFPSAWGERERFDGAREWINKFAPDWLSLQFVPFSFQAKGLPFGLSSMLQTLGKGRRWHIMFHELWVGMDVKSSKKHIFWGWIQRQLIKSLLENLKPAIIHTQTRLYQLLLSQLGYKALYLPLFTNVPAIQRSRRGPLAEQLNSLSFVLFGGIHPASPAEDFAREAAMYASKRKVQLLLIIIGRCGNEQERWVDAWKSAGLRLRLYGEQPPERISRVLERASIGISTTPFELAEKSGSVAAMWEHGLPVICVSQPWYPRKVKRLEPSPGIVEYRPGNLDTCIRGKGGSPCIYQASEVSRQLTDSLLITV